MASTAGLGSAMREEVWAIVRAAVEEAMGPLVARQRELEARVERAERLERERANDAERAPRARPAAATAQTAQTAQPAPTATAVMQGGASSAAAKLASIPVAFGSVAPPAVAPARVAVPQFEQSPSSVTNPGGATIPDMKAAPPYQSGASLKSAHPAGPRPSLPPTGYGVSVIAAPRASLDLEAVGAIDLEGFDGGRRKKRVAGVVVVLMLLLIAGAITMTVLSHN